MEEEKIVEKKEVVQAEGASKGALSSPLAKILVIAVVLLLAVNIYFLLGFNSPSPPTLPSQGNQQNQNAQQQAQPKPIVYLTTIVKSDCEKCTQISGLSDALGQLSDANFVESSLEFGSAEATQLIEKYGIERLPTLLLKTDDANALASFNEIWPRIGSVEQDGVLIAREIPAPFFDMKSAKAVGLVDLVSLSDSSCEKCSKPLTAQDLESAGIGIYSSKEVEASSDEGRALIAKYSIEKLPTIIASNDINAYDSMREALSNIGEYESDGFYVLREVQPPYNDLSTGKLVGLTSLTYLVDASCAECYDANVHRQILENNFGIAVESEKYIDISSAEGKALLADYNITAVPTAIISGDASAYTGLNSAWGQVGTVEPDGAYVFRELSLLGEIKFKDLASGKIIDANSLVNG
ncbi:MAG: hypothetical protein V1494_03585 [Candidatus Diapherotrites archaeon]